MRPLDRGCTLRARPVLEEEAWHPGREHRGILPRVLYSQVPERGYLWH
jgi:hypothetical protein